MACVVNTAVSFQLQDIMYELFFSAFSGVWLSCTGQRGWETGYWGNLLTLYGIQTVWRIWGPTEYEEVRSTRLGNQGNGLGEAASAIPSSGVPESPTELNWTDDHWDLNAFSFFKLGASAADVVLKWQMTPQSGWVHWTNKCKWQKSFYHSGLSGGAARPHLKWR